MAGKHQHDPEANHGTARHAIEPIEGGSVAAEPIQMLAELRIEEHSHPFKNEKYAPMAAKLNMANAASPPLEARTAARTPSCNP
jgi:hypothetical protein